MQNNKFNDISSKRTIIGDNLDDSATVTHVNCKAYIDIGQMNCPKEIFVNGVLLKNETEETYS